VGRLGVPSQKPALGTADVATVRTFGCAGVKVPADPEIEPQPTRAGSTAQQVGAAMLSTCFPFVGMALLAVRPSHA
jgi:hypothetical protein